MNGRLPVGGRGKAAIGRQTPRAKATTRAGCPRLRTGSARWKISVRGMPAAHPFERRASPPPHWPRARIVVMEKKQRTGAGLSLTNASKAHRRAHPLGTQGRGGCFSPVSERLGALSILD
jgi:hypothetical protein